MKNSQKIIFSDVKIVIFDMDGTLYKLDGENNSFKNSTLQNEVFKRAIKFISKKEKISLEKAAVVFETISRKNEMISVSLSERYQIPRTEYLNFAWNIKPNNFVKDFEIPKNFVQKIRLPKFLLTSAPSVWQKNVLSHIGIESEFNEIYSGENFGMKDEIFKILSKKFNPNSVLSIGDQYETDIRPAKELGMQTFHINSQMSLDDISIISYE